MMHPAKWMHLLALWVHFEKATQRKFSTSLSSNNISFQRMLAALAGIYLQPAGGCSNTRFSAKGRAWGFLLRGYLKLSISSHIHTHGPCVVSFPLLLDAEATGYPVWSHAQAGQTPMGYASPVSVHTSALSSPYTSFFWSYGLYKPRLIALQSPQTTARGIVWANK